MVCPEFLRLEFSDLKQKQHKKWNLDFSDKNQNLKVRQSKIFFLNRDLPFWYVKNCTANSTFVAPDLNASFYPKWVKKKCQKKHLHCNFWNFSERVVDAGSIETLNTRSDHGSERVLNVSMDPASIGRSKFFQKLPNRPKWLNKSGPDIARKWLLKGRFLQ